MNQDGLVAAAEQITSLLADRRIDAAVIDVKSPVGLVQLGNFGERFPAVIASGQAEPRQTRLPFDLFLRFARDAFLRAPERTPAGLPLALEADDSAHDYEQKYCPDGASPPTGCTALYVRLSRRERVDVLTRSRGQ